MANMKQMIELTKKRVTAVDEEVELWKADHEFAMLMYDLEEIAKKHFADLVFLFEHLIKLDESYRLQVARKKLPWSDEVDQAVEDALRLWITTTKKVLKVREIFDQALFEADIGDGPLLIALHEAEAMLNPDYMEVKGPMVDLVTKGLEEHRAGRMEDL